MRKETQTTEWSAIQEEAKLLPYRAPPLVVMTRAAGSPSTVKPLPLSVGKTDVGPYSIYSRRSPTSCRIRLVVNLPEGKSKVIGVWTGDSDSCQWKVHEITKAIYQIRAGKVPKPSITISETIPSKKTASKKPSESVSSSDVEDRYIVTSKHGSVTGKAVPLGMARQVAKAISTVELQEVNIRDLRGQVEESYKGGGKTFTREPRQAPPIGRQFHTPVPERPVKNVRAELLAAAKRSDVSEVIRLTKELAGD